MNSSEKRIYEIQIVEFHKTPNKSVKKSAVFGKKRFGQKLQYNFEFSNVIKYYNYCSFWPNCMFMHTTTRYPTRI